MRQDGSDHRRGLIFAILTFASWGLLPFYFKALSSINPIEILCMRVTMSCVLILAILAVRRELGDLVAAFRTPRILSRLTTSGILIAINWLVYIMAVAYGHMIAASLAYFLNPLINVLLGVLFLGERLRPVQWVAIALAAAGVAIMGVAASETLGISLVLGISFAFYGLVRKLTPVSPLVGLGVETTILFPLALVALAWIATHDGLGFGRESFTTALLLASGVVTSTPLLLFASAARLLPLVTLGLVQYMTPTILFVTAVVFYGEPLTLMKWATFGLIWTGLALFVGHTLHGMRRARIAL